MRALTVSLPACPFFPIGDPLLRSEFAPSVSIATHGQLLGRSQAIQLGTSWKQVDQFLGVPYATPPLAESRFQAPEPLNWTGSWDATKPR
jgi:thyroglobulin